MTVAERSDLSLTGAPVDLLDNSANPDAPNATMAEAPLTAPAASEVACWDITELGKQAKGQYERIERRSALAALDYWRLGALLEQARGNFTRGRWLPWLAEHEIPRRHADDARLLARAFRSADEFAGLTKEAACRLARATLRQAARDDAGRKLRRKINSIRKALQATAPALGKLPRSAALCRLVDSVVADAQALRRACGP